MSTFNKTKARIGMCVLLGMEGRKNGTKYDENRNNDYITGLDHYMNYSVEHLV